MTTYNGYTNSDTYHAALIIDNDETIGAAFAHKQITSVASLRRAVKASGLYAAEKDGINIKEVNWNELLQDNIELWED